MKPFEDELLSSWLVRLAMAHGLKLNTFSKLVWNKSTIWNRDLDKSAGENILSVLQKNTGFSDEIINKTLLCNFTGSLYEKHNPNGNSAWIMPIGIFHSMRTSFGLQMCPQCLKEDSQSYFRRSWRLSFITVCLHHKINLLDRCPNCQKPIIFHRGELGNRNKISSNGMTICPFCNCNWKSLKTIQYCSEASSDLVKFQSILMQAITEKWINLRRYGFIHSVLFFKGLYQLLKLLSCSNKGLKFRQIVSEVSQIQTTQVTIKKHQTFDQLTIEYRQSALKLAFWLLSEWSERLVEICRKNKIWSSSLLYGFTDTPFWYWNPIHQNLYRIAYFPSEDEIKSVMDFLKKKGEIITYKKLCNIMGMSTIVKNRNEKFIQSIVADKKEFNQSLTKLFT